MEFRKYLMEKKAKEKEKTQNDVRRIENSKISVLNPTRSIIRLCMNGLNYLIKNQRLLDLRNISALLCAV